MNKKQLIWGIEEINSREDVKKLPSSIQGVYIMESVLLDVFYVGKTEKQGIQKRIDQHYGTQEENEIILHEIKQNWPINVYYSEVDESDIPGVEQFLKNYFEPEGNKNDPSSNEYIECNIPPALEQIYSLKLFK